MSERYSVKTSVITLTVLRIVANNAPISMAEVLRVYTTNFEPIEKNKIYRHLQTLTECGFIRQNESRLYELADVAASIQSTASRDLVVGIIRNAEELLRHYANSAPDSKVVQEARPPGIRGPATDEDTEELFSGGEIWDE